MKHLVKCRGIAYAFITRIIDAHHICETFVMEHLFDISAPKRPTNLTVNSDLLAAAKKMKINISATLEEALANKVRQERAGAWLAENKVAIEQYNDFVEKNGVFSDGLRKF